jgi:hypothetical protein
MTKTTRARVWRPGSRLAVVALAIAPLAPAGPMGAVAQEPTGRAGTLRGDSLVVRGEAAEPCTEGRVLGSLGITGIRCDHCSFSSSNGILLEARFDTEPEILQVQPGSGLRAGDVLVAADGELITTRAGVRRLLALEPERELTLRVRRDGVERDVRVRALAACVPPEAPATPLPPGAPTAAAAPLPLDPPATPLPDVAPSPPVVSEMRPDARLGFGFECDRCSYAGSSRLWSFERHPRVRGVEPGGPADGRLRPGDELRAVNGADLTTEAGGRAFSGIRPGGDVRWTVRRDGRTLDVVTQAEHKAGDLVPAALATTVAPALPALAGSAVAAASTAVAAVGSSRSVLRYAGGVGPAQVEVRGEPVTVLREGNVLVVRTRGNEIRIVVEGGGGR